MARAQQRPKAGISLLGVRIEAHALWRLKWHYLRVVDFFEARSLTPSSFTVRAVTGEFSLKRRRRWKQRGLLARLDPILSGGRMRIPFGLAEGMRLDTGHLDLAGAQAYATVRGIHEPMVQEALRRTLGPGDVFYDVGANIGLMSLAASRLVGPSGTVVSIEPDPANVRALHAQAQINRLNGLVIIDAAAAAQSGTAELIAVADTLWTRLACVGEHSLERERLTVRAISLDDLVSSGDVPPPDVVKIDVEGGELLVLEGMRQLLASHRPTIVIEMHGKSAAVCELLERGGYRISNLDAPTPAAASHESHILASPA